MRYLGVLLLTLLAGYCQAQERGDLRLVQAWADFPSMTIWANLPDAAVIDREQFELTVDDHEARLYDVDRFQDSGEGVGYIFLVDIGKSLGSRQLVQVKRALYHWLEKLGPNDQAALVVSGHEAGHELAFTADAFKLSNAISLMAVADAETDLHHALEEVVNLGRNRDKSLPARRAVVLLGNIADAEKSAGSLDSVLKQIEEYRLPIYAIGWSGDVVAETQAHQPSLLAKLAAGSGGYFVPADVQKLESAVEDQHRRITQAYRLRLDCPDCQGNIGLHRIDINWRDGRNSLSESVEMRLLPKAVAGKSPVPDGKEAKRNPARLPFVVFLIVLATLAWIYRQRL